ncbi:c-type cytochrome [Allomesorhizobium camelthorni]|uniref:Cytochrome c family protein n=1 Tax=Allomesorhizobium camelthorni TaxID=475069 RepID=A0A6G4WN31_9HYPH|nr:cytochrome c family protein [Mesorhizobium camelthorni]NGO56225.1 cytochrome c family protein [Mesorhizobium camelthorni]
MEKTRKIGAFITVVMFAGLVARAGYAQDAEHGKSVFKACAVCHATDSANRVGPGLEGIIGRKAGAAADFRYSNAMKNSAIVWDAASLNAFLESPRKAVPGTKMAYGGLKDPTDRADLIGYLATLK